MLVALAAAAAPPPLPLLACTVESARWRESTRPHHRPQNYWSSRAVAFRRGRAYHCAAKTPAMLMAMHSVAALVFGALQLHCLTAGEHLHLSWDFSYWTRVADLFSLSLFAPLPAPSLEFCGIAAARLDPEACSRHVSRLDAEALCSLARWPELPL